MCPGGSWGVCVLCIIVCPGNRERGRESYLRSMSWGLGVEACPGGCLIVCPGGEGEGMIDEKHVLGGV